MGKSCSTLRAHSRYISRVTERLILRTILTTLKTVGNQVAIRGLMKPGSVYVITGASSGIGRGVAIEAHRRGHRVACLARRKERLEDLTNELNAQRPSSAIFCEVDVTKKASLEAALNQICSTFGRIDALFANAGFGVASRFEKLTTEDFRRQFETNVFGVIESIYTFLPEIKKQKGSIAIMGSANSYVSEPKKIPYSMSKFAVKALADGLYWEMKPEGVAVTLICPGIIESEIRKVNNMGAFNAEAKDPAPENLIMKSNVAAKKIVNAIDSRKKELLLTIHGTLAIYAQRFAPALLSPILRTGKSVSRK